MSTARTPISPLKGLTLSLIWAFSRALQPLRTIQLALILTSWLLPKSSGKNEVAQLEAILAGAKHILILGSGPLHSPHLEDMYDLVLYANATPPIADLRVNRSARLFTCPMMGKHRPAEKTMVALRKRLLNNLTDDYAVIACPAATEEDFAELKRETEYQSRQNLWLSPGVIWSATVSCLGKNPKAIEEISANSIRLTKFDSWMKKILKATPTSIKIPSAFRLSSVSILQVLVECHSKATIIDVDGFDPTSLVYLDKKLSYKHSVPGIQKENDLIVTKSIAKISSKKWRYGFRGHFSK